MISATIHIHNTFDNGMWWRSVGTLFDEDRRAVVLRSE
ncbi:hypothetical protein HMPREF7215_1879 [Pyramidobacter piscolens W5455]|uniref:Uncharacterized protein n=1 Tax=Pyramidobacter piscolens W5455 TaxID=352165 RepID=A0ABP2HT96_9BACT|nr:hypothetical protein HMPREF7215_1879 [Pyramidobacter piscolens W5455]